MDELILETIFRHLKASEITSTWSVWLEQGEGMFNNLVDSNGEVIGLIEERRAVGIVYLDFT